MFRANEKHLQPSLISDVTTMLDAQRKRLEESWAPVFFEYCFRRIDETIFAVLYTDEPSRPNVPVNVLVGLEILKSGMGWSDAELYDAFLFDMQVRYALGYESLNDGYFSIRSLYHFRERLTSYNQEHGINLLDVAFEAITDDQVKRLEIRTKTLRMDSTQIASDIRDSNRLYLLVEGVSRLYRVLDATEQASYASLCEAYIESGSKHYVYGVRGGAATDAALQAIGPVLAQMLSGLKEQYASESAYQTAQRLFDENYRLEPNGVEPKANSEIGSGVLQSLDDLEASFRRKNGEEYKGYVANISESCDEENDVQLILKVQVAPNNTDDAALLVEAMPNLVERTEVDKLYTDGGFGSDDADRVLNQHQVVQIQSALRGNAPDPNKFSLADYEIEQDAEGKPTHFTCPQGQRIEVEPGRTTGFLVRFDLDICAGCPLQATCRAQPQKRDPRYTISFTQEEVFRAQRRRRHRDFLDSPGNPRAAVEASVRSVKHPFRNGKVPVRGIFRVTCMIVASAAMCNVRRIQRYLAQKGPFRHFCSRISPCRLLPRLLSPSDWRSMASRRFHRRIYQRHLCRTRISCFSS